MKIDRENKKKYRPNKIRPWTQKYMRGRFIKLSLSCYPFHWNGIKPKKLVIFSKMFFLNSSKETMKEPKKNSKFSSWTKMLTRFTWHTTEMALAFKMTDKHIENILFTYMKNKIKSIINKYCKAFLHASLHKHRRNFILLKNKTFIIILEIYVCKC